MNAILHIIVFTMFSMFTFVVGANDSSPFKGKTANEVAKEVAALESEAEMAQARHAFYWFLGGEIDTLLPSQVEIGAGVRTPGQMIEAEVFVGSDLINVYGPRPFVVPTGARMRLWPQADGRYFIEVEGVDYQANQAQSMAFTKAYGAGVGLDTGEGLRITIGASRTFENGDYQEGELDGDFNSVKLKIQKVFPPRR